MNKLYDVVIKTGSYQNSQGETRGRYENIGSVMQGQDGGQFIILKRTFNPAGAPNPENKDSVILSCFQPKENGGYNQGSQQPRGQSNQGRGQQQSKPQGEDDLHDDIPF